MDYDGYERKPPQVPKPLSREEELRVAVNRTYEAQRLEERRKDALTFFQNDPEFWRRVAGHDIYNEYDQRTKDLIAAAAAQDIAQKFTGPNIGPAELGGVVDRAVASGLEQARSEHEQNQQHSQQPKPSAASEPNQGKQPDRPDYTARNEPHIDRTAPSAKWHGKYRELEELAPNTDHRLPSDEPTRRQQEDNQKAVPEPSNPEREQTEEAYRAVGDDREMTDARQAKLNSILERMAQDRADGHDHVQSQEHIRDGRSED
jgi:hypothetical protein